MPVPKLKTRIPKKNCNDGLMIVFSCFSASRSILRPMNAPETACTKILIAFGNTAIPVRLESAAVKIKAPTRAPAGTLIL